MKNYKSITLLIPILLLIIPSDVFAHGDPLVVYEVIGIGALHFALGIYLAASKRIRNYKILLLSIYLASVVITWFWSVDLPGPNYTWFYITSIGCPLAVFVFALYLNFRKEG